MSGLCDGRVAIVTGAGRGIGRGHALELARQGASVVVNDRGVELDGQGHDQGPAASVVAEIRAAGGVAIANSDDVGDWDGAKHLIDQAVDELGRVDVLVNNAGFVRDRMLVNMTEDDWDAVVRVHLKGTFCTTKHAADHWRTRAKAGEAVNGRVVNTSSGAGLYGNFGQTNYGAAKAAIATFSILAAAELARYGVTVNAIAPGGLTRMTEKVITRREPGPDGFNPMAPENVAPVVAWLASLESADVTGRVFDVLGGRIGVSEGWRPGPFAEQPRRWEAAELGPVVADLLARAAPPAPFLGYDPAARS